MCLELITAIRPQIKITEALENVQESLERREKAGKDFAFFCETYLPEAFTVPFAEYHKLIIEIINNQQITQKQIDKIKPLVKPAYEAYLKPLVRVEGIIDVEPREHGKTTRMSQAFPLFLALTRENVFPLIVGVSKEKATEYLDSIKLELENNELIHEDFGDQRGHIWKSNRIVLQNGNAIAALGRGESIRGIKVKYRRPTHVICDDLLKDKEVESPALREFTDTWFRRVIMNLGKNALVILVNTIMHPDDLPSRRLKDLTEGKLAKWIGLRFSAYKPDGKPLWPRMWTRENLEEKKTNLGSFVFSTEWDNDPLPEGGKKFNKAKMKFFNLEDINLREYVLSFGIDPATGKEFGSDSAIAIVGQHPRGYIDVLDEFGGKISDLEFIDKIIEKYLFWESLVKVKYITFEEVLFQEIYKNDLTREALKRGIILPVKGRKQHANKLFRIGRLSAPVEAGIIRFKRGLQLPGLLDEFPKGLLDLPDSLEMAVSPFIKEPIAKPYSQSLGVQRQTHQVMRGFDGHNGR